MTSELFRLVFHLTLFLPLFDGDKKLNRNSIDERCDFATAKVEGKKSLVELIELIKKQFIK